MFRMIPVAIAAATLFSAPDPSLARYAPRQIHTIGESHTTCPKPAVRHNYRRRYKQVARKFGTRTPGRDIRTNGMTGKEPSRCFELARSNRTFKRWLAPPIAPALAGDRSPSSAPYNGGGAYSIPTEIVMCESGGNYNAYNPSSGARGAYQVLESTHASICPDLGWDPQGQDICASRIMAVQGRGAWVC